MSCEGVQPKIRQFLDDLLDEREYQQIHSHISECVACQNYASSVGTLSYQLYELGQVSLPPDMVSTVLYEFKKQVPTSGQERTEVRVDSPGLRTAVFVLCAVAAAVFLAVALVGVRHYQKEKKAVSAKALAGTGSPADRSADQRDQAALEKISAIVYASDDNVTEAQKLEKVGAVLSERKGPADLSARWNPVHRHYHLSRSSQSELGALLGEFRFQIDNESADYYVFYVPADKWDAFQRRLAELSGVVKEYGETGAAGAADRPVQVSVYLD